MTPLRYHSSNLSLIALEGMRLLVQIVSDYRHSSEILILILMYFNKTSYYAQIGGK